ncbi:MAG: hypothetical protein CFE28_00650 [Alphaproteobacteria bacterium PA2]|jgi:uncharacterized membrane protein YkvA (DUF1232 family)|nr:MAG: hypothetical protein CFE28_00650 [Alphaproteobacteria bacterium PA2]
MSAKSKASPDVNNDSFDAKGPIDPAKALVPQTLRVNEERVRQGFLPKIARVAASIPFARDAISVWYCARDPQTPLGAKGMMMAALAYFVLPTDAFPDFLGVIGFTDDAAVFAALIAIVGRHLKPHHRAAADALLVRLQQT